MTGPGAALGILDGTDSGMSDVTGGKEGTEDDEAIAAGRRSRRLRAHMNTDELLTTHSTWTGSGKTIIRNWRLYSKKSQKLK